MSRKTIKAILLSSLIFFAGISAYSQDGAYNSYSPYSVFGVGDLIKDGPAYSRSMGGVGIASRNHRFVNYMNPAAVTARKTPLITAWGSRSIIRSGMKFTRATRSSPSTPMMRKRWEMRKNVCMEPTSSVKLRWKNSRSFTELSSK